MFTYWIKKKYYKENKKALLATSHGGWYRSN